MPPALWLFFFGASPVWTVYLPATVVWGMDAEDLGTVVEEQE